MATVEMNPISDAGTPPPSAPPIDPAAGLGSPPDVGTSATMPTLAPQAGPPPAPHSGILSDILHAVGDVLGGPKTRQQVDPVTGNVSTVPLSRRERIAGTTGMYLKAAGAGLAAHGPGSIGQAAILGSQSEQETLDKQRQAAQEDSANVRQGIEQRATIQYHNQQMLLQQREMDHLDTQDREMIASSNRNFEQKVQELGWTKPVILVNGKDVNGTLGNEAPMREFFSGPGSHRAPDGFSYSYVPTMDEKGNATHTVWQAPINSMSQPVSLTREELKEQTGIDSPMQNPTMTAGQLIAARSAFSESKLRAAQEKRQQKESDRAEQLLPGQIKQQGAELEKTKAEAERDRALASAVGASPVYAIDPKGNTVLTTKGEALANGMTGVRTVKQSDISKDQHDIKVLNDIQAKSNNVRIAAGAMDQKSWTQAGIAAKYLADNPNTTFNTLLKSDALKYASPQTIAYVIAINSLRETALGLQKVLTGTARQNETQLIALQNTLPGVEPNSGIVGQKLQAFEQNIGMLRQGLPMGTGIENLNSGNSPTAAAAPTHAVIVNGVVVGYTSDGKSMTPAPPPK